MSEEIKADNEAAVVDEINGAADAVAEAEAALGAKRAAGHREMAVSTLLHLMGVPSTAEIQLLENKLDLLTSKVTRVGLQLERIGNQFAALSDNLYLDRIDFQIADLRNVIKKLFPKAMASGEISFESDQQQGE